MSRIRLSFTLSAVIAIAAAATAVADPCAGPSDRPAVCTVQAFGGSAARLQPIDVDSPILLPVGESITIELRAYDQFRRPFRTDRLAYGHEVEGCTDDELAVEQLQVGRFQVTAGARRGDCRLWLWIPGDLNFEWPLVFRVEGRDRTGYSSSEAEFVAVRLYRGLLGRDPDPNGLRETVAAIERGNLAQRIQSMVRSTEFGNKVDRTTPKSILERLYDGILGRPLDPVGERAFLSAIEQGRIEQVVQELLGSEEFQTKLIGRDRPQR